MFTLLATFFASTLAEIKDINFKCGQASQQWKLSTTKCQSPYAESWLVDPMSELLLFVYNKSHVTLHVKSSAEKVNSPTYLRSLIKLSHNYPYSFRQVGVVTSTLASLQRNEEYQTKQREALAGLKGLCNIADRVLTYGCEYNRRRMCLALALVDGSCKMISLWHLTLTPCR